MAVTRWMPGFLRRRLGDVLFNRLFSFWQGLGFHVMPNNYMSPIPDLRTLKPDLWATPSDLAGIEMNDERQRDLLRRIAGGAVKEYEAWLASPERVSYAGERSKFGPVDAAVLYGMIRSVKPRIILEVGSGHSTYVMGGAALRNRQDGVATELIACEPYPNAALRAGLPGVSRLLPRPAQEIELSEFLRLQRNDILFIDSSHVLRTGGDVAYLYLEVLPRVQAGVYVHVHDIFFPFEYPAPWLLENHRFYSEQYLLQAFLMFNRAFAVLWAARYMYWRYPKELAAVFPAYDSETSGASSLWMQKTG